MSGLGCGEILRGESGLHVLEQVDDERDGDKVVDREQVRVLVLAKTPGPEAGAATMARDALQAAGEAETTAVIVRRYRPGRAPLVRDSSRAATGRAASTGFSQATSTSSDAFA